MGNHLSVNNNSLAYFFFMLKVPFNLLALCTNESFSYEVDCAHLCLFPEYNGTTFNFILLNKDEFYQFLVDTPHQDKAVSFYFDLSVVIFFF